MYKSIVDTQDEALTHLFFHCCLKDGVFKDSEVDEVSGKLVKLGLEKRMNFKDEVVKYKSYRSSVTREEESMYLDYLLSLITPVNELALYSYCAELVLCDSRLSMEEDQLLGSIAAALNIGIAESETIKKLMIQRNVVATEKIF